MIGETEVIQKIDLSTFDDKVIRFPSRSILDVVPVIKAAQFVVTIDTSITHIAASYQKPSLVYYIEDMDEEKVHAKIKKLRASLKRKAQACLIACEEGEEIAKNKTAYYQHEIYWGPNNPFATQVIFYVNEIKEVPNNELIGPLASFLSQQHY